MIETLLQFAENNSFQVTFEPFKGKANGLLILDDKNKIWHIGLAERLKKNPAKASYILAHEIAHAYLHYDKGNTITSLMRRQYEEQADRGAQIMLDLIAFMEKPSNGSKSIPDANVKNSPQ